MFLLVFPGLLRGHLHSVATMANCMAMQTEDTLKSMVPLGFKNRKLGCCKEAILLTMVPCFGDII